MSDIISGVWGYIERGIILQEDFAWGWANQGFSLNYSLVDQAPCLPLSSPLPLEDYVELVHEADPLYSNRVGDSLDKQLGQLPLTGR